MIVPDLTVAIEESEVSHVTWRLFASAGWAEAFTCTWRLTATFTASCFSVIDVTSCCTVTVKDPVTFVPSIAVASMVAWPFETPVTTPFASTVATPGRFDDQVTFRMVALSGEHTASSSMLSPANSVLDAASIEIFFTGCTTTTRNSSTTSGFCTLETVRTHSPASTPRRLPSADTLAIPTSDVA